MTYSSLSVSGNRLARTPIRQDRFSSQGRNTINFSITGGKLGPVSNTVILVVMACLLGLLYLTQVTKTDAYGYSIDKLQTRQTQLKRENDDLTLASAQMQSLDRVQASTQATAMVPAAPSATLR